jgi:hypothetical protein
MSGLWFSPGTPVSSINKTDRHYIAEIFIGPALNTMPLDCFMLYIPGLFSIKNREGVIHNGQFRGIAIIRHTFISGLFS